MTPSQPVSGSAAARPRTQRSSLARLSTLLLLLMVASQVLAACSGARPQGEAGGLDLRISSSALASSDPTPVPADVAVMTEEPPLAPVVQDPNTVQRRADGVQVAALPAALPGSGAPAAAPALVAAPVAGAPAAEGPAAESPAEEGSAPEALEVVPVVQTMADAPAAAPQIGPAVSLDETTNVLVLGSDRRVGMPNWRTDVMMIVALDEANGRAGVISLPRDIFIDEIPGHRPNKINVLDYLGERDEPDGGGPELIKAILLEKMGIRIDHWVRFDFTGFVELVDALGGVEIEIDCPYYDYFQIEDVILNVKPGIERLSGEEALVYVRSRKIGGDLDRARRQQRFIWAVRNQVLNENILPKLPALYNAVSDTVQTDLGVVGTLKVARFAMGLDREDITGFVVGYPLVEQGWAGNMWVFLADWDAIRAEMQNVFAREPFLNTNTLAECP
jgi:LCP family protein required for cell wall assembly